MASSTPPGGGRPRAQASGVWRDAFLPVAVAAALFVPTVRHGFIWDDPLVLEQLRAIHGWRDLVVPPEIVPRFYFRPFIFLTFLLDRAFGGESPAVFHATVIAWHALVTGVVFLLARAWLGAERVWEAGVGALLFAVHPIHVESVAWIAGRSDVMATAWLLAALLCAARTECGWSAWAAGALLCLGLLSKEMAVAGLVLIPLRDWCAERRWHWVRYVPLGVAAGIYFILRRGALGTVGGGFATGVDPLVMVRELLAAIGWYGAKLVWPWPQNAYVPAVPDGWSYPVVGAMGTALLFAAAVWAWSTERRAVAFFLLWLPVTLAPSLLVIVRRSASAVLAERYLYLPSVAWVLLIAQGFGAWRAKRRDARICVAVVGILALLWAAQSVVRARVWADDLSFWTDVAAQSPADAMPHRELGAAYLQRDRFDDAERELLRAVAAGGDAVGQVMSYNNLGNLYLRRGRPDAASDAFAAGIKIHRHPYLLNGLGRVAIRRAEAAQQRGDQAEVMRQVVIAREALRQAVALDPRDSKSHALLGQVLFNLGDRVAAREHLETALRIEPRGGVADTAREFLRRLGP